MRNCENSASTRTIGENICVMSTANRIAFLPGNFSLPRAYAAGTAQRRFRSVAPAAMMRLLRKQLLVLLPKLQLLLQMHQQKAKRKKKRKRKKVNLKKEKWERKNIWKPLRMKVIQKN